jgi:hypothetical protein
MDYTAGPVSPKPDHARISAVYTLDAGGGRLRGVSTGNPSLTPIFRHWLEPFRDLGVTMVADRLDCGGDCWTFAQIGIPTPPSSKTRLITTPVRTIPTWTPMSI